MMAINTDLYYRSIDDANAYFDEQLFADDWTSATETDREKAMLAATRAFNQVRFVGVKQSVGELLRDDLNTPEADLVVAEESQVKQWPRIVGLTRQNRTFGLSDQSDGIILVTPQTTQTLLQFTTLATVGSYFIKITLEGGVTFTTAALLFSSDAATIQAAIDAAATGVVPNWTNGDIAVSGSDLNTGTALLTFSGDSVKDQAHSTRPEVTPDGTFDGVIASPSGAANVTGEFPDTLFYAVCEEASNLLAQRDPDQEFENLWFTSDGVSSTRVSSDRTQMSPRHSSHFITSATAWKYMQEYLDPCNKTFRVERA